MKIKKILIVYSGAKHQGGIERYLENLFALYDKKRLKLILVSLGEWPLTEKIRKTGAKTIVLAGGRVLPQNILKISKIVSEEKASLIVSQGVVANSYARSAAALSKTPHLTTVHSDMDLDYSNPLIRSVYKTSDKVVRWRTDRYIAVSKHLRSKLIKSGIKGDKISVIYNGVSEIKSKKAKKDGEIVIGSIGRLHKVKGYEKLIKAFSIVNSTGLKLIIWGEGPERKSLEALIDSLGLKGKVELAGFTDDIVGALSKTDIYVQPSLSEGFGLTVVEAMLAGKPIIVTPVGSLKEIVTDGETGIIAKSTSPKALANSLERLLSDEELLKNLGENAKRDAKERFSMKSWVRETEKAYLETAK